MLREIYNLVGDIKRGRIIQNEEERHQKHFKNAMGSYSYNTLLAVSFTPSVLSMSFTPSVLSVNFDHCKLVHKMHRTPHYTKFTDTSMAVNRGMRVNIM